MTHRSDVVISPEKVAKLRLLNRDGRRFAHELIAAILVSHESLRRQSEALERAMDEPAPTWIRRDPLPGTVAFLLGPLEREVNELRRAITRASLRVVVYEPKDTMR